MNKNKISEILFAQEELLTKLNGKNSTTEICQLKTEYPWFKIDYTDQEIAFKIIDLDIILPTRMPEENFMDLLNLLRTSYRIEGGNWEKALVSFCQRRMPI